MLIPLWRGPRRSIPWAVAGVVAPISTRCGPGAAGTGAARSRE
jgi:hypothetical protein